MGPGKQVAQQPPVPPSAPKPEAPKKWTQPKPGKIFLNIIFEFSRIHLQVQKQIISEIKILQIRNKNKSSQTDKLKEYLELIKMRVLTDTDMDAVF